MRVMFGHRTAQALIDNGADVYNRRNAQYASALRWICEEDEAPYWLHPDTALTAEAVEAAVLTDPEYLAARLIPHGIIYGLEVLNEATKWRAWLRWKWGEASVIDNPRRSAGYSKWDLVYNPENEIALRHRMAQRLEGLVVEAGNDLELRMAMLAGVEALTEI